MERRREGVGRGRREGGKDRGREQWIEGARDGGDGREGGEGGDGGEGEGGREGDGGS